MSTVELCLESREEVAWSKIWRIEWLGDGRNLVLQQKVFCCKGGVTRHVVAWDPVVSPCFQPFPPRIIPHMLQTFVCKSEFTVWPTGTNAYFITPKLSIKVSSMAVCYHFMTDFLFWGDGLVYHSKDWCFISGL